MPPSHTAFLVVAVLAAQAAVAGAQRPAPPPSADSARADTARKLDAVVVTETRAAAVTGGASAVMIRTDALRGSPAPVLEEALRESPFVHVRQNSRGEMELSVRGSDSRQAAVLLDGVPLTLGYDHRIDPSLVPIAGAQNLVIVRGLASLLNGPNTLGGTIEVSHDDAFGRLGTGRLWGGAGVDENGAYVASIGGGRGIRDVGAGALSLRGGVSHRQRDGFTLAAGAPDPTARGGLRTNSDLRESDAFASVRWNGPVGRSFGALVTAFNAERGVPPEEHIAAPRLWRYPYNRRAVVTVSGNTGSFATPFGFASLEVGGGYNAGQMKIEAYQDRDYATVTAIELGDERTWTTRALLSHSLPGAARLRVAATFADVVYEETQPPTPRADYEQRLWSVASEMDVPVTPRTTLAAGVAYDRAATPRTGGRTAGGERFDDLAWRAGLTHDPSAVLRLHANVSRRARFPSLRELYSGALNRFAPNPALRPETLLGLEAGLTLDRSLGRSIPDATLQLNGFHHRLDDAVVRVTLPPPDRRFQRINRDRLESSGVELLAGLAFAENRDRAVTLTGDALVQHLRLRDATLAGQPRRHAENNPEVRGMLELGVPLPSKARGFANVRYTGVQYCLNADTGGEQRLAAAGEANAALERQFTLSRGGAIRSLRALLALDNAFNAAIYDQCGLPQPGRTLRVMFTLR